MYTIKYHPTLCGRELKFMSKKIKVLLPFPLSDWPNEAALHAVGTQQADPLIKQKGN